jgi:hypothetical protein
LDPYPAGFECDYGDGVRSRGLAVAGIVYFVKALLIIPHVIILGFLQFIAVILAYVGYWIVAFTGQLPPGIAQFVTGTIAWYARMTAWIAALTDEYPPFQFETPAYPAVATATSEDRKSKGWAVLGILGLKYLAALPHFIVWGFVTFAAGIAAWVNFFIIAFTGVSNQGIHDFVVGTTRWGVRIYAWLAGLNDRYPPFSLD